MVSAPSVSPLRRLLEDRVSQLLSDAEQWAAETRLRTTRECMERLNQSVRRIRQAASLSELAGTVVDASAGFASGTALFAIEAETARLENVRGASQEAAEPLRAGISLSAVPAIGGAIESRDPVIAAATAGEVSAQLTEAFGHGPEDRVSILPIVARDRVPAVLYAWGEVEGSALELLAQVAAACWSDLQPAPTAAPSTPLVTIVPAAPVAQQVAAGGWDSLSREEQQVHLRAQRFARVQVAELRLQHAEAVLSGRAGRNLYTSLREPIDAARDAFSQKFFAHCQSMVDYLHLELLRTLAHDDAELLGQDYPGPLV